MVQVIVRWIIYSLLLGVVPIMAVVVWRYFRTSEMSLAKSVRHGELLLVVSMLNGAAIGEALDGGPSGSAITIITVGCAVLVLFLGTLLYAFVASSERLISPQEIGRIGRVSIRMFVSGAFTSAACVVAGCLS